MFSVVVRGPAAGRSARKGEILSRQSVPGFRAAGAVYLLAGALLLSGCASNPELASNQAAPRAGASSSKAALPSKARAATLRAVRDHGDARADVTATIKPAPAAPIPLPDEALLKRQPPPDCEMRTQPAGVGPTEVKLATYDYERQCYRQVETIVRGRLDALQDAVEETVKAVKSLERTGQSRVPPPVN